MNTEPPADWSAGVRNPETCSPAGLRASAKIALYRASGWIETAKRLLAKAEDLERGN